MTNDHVWQRRTALGAIFAVTLLVVQFGTIRFASSDQIVRIVLPVTIALIPFALWPHRHYVGVWVMFVGLTANLFAIAANGGLMPIEHHTVVQVLGAERAAEHPVGEWLPGSKDVIVAGSGRLVPLGDSIVIDGGRTGMVVSPGDLVIWAGLLSITAEASLAWQRRTRTSTTAAREGAAAERGATT
jgi:hypothetical protein